MSYENFEKALELAKKCKSYTVSGAKTEEIIESAASLLGLTFSRQNHDFYSTVGYLSFFGSEIYEIDPDDIDGILEGNSVAYALSERRHYALPQEWLPIYFFDDGYLGCLDYSQLNEDGEPPVIMALCNGEKYVFVERVAEDLGDFILELVERQLSMQ